MLRVYDYSGAEIYPIEVKKNETIIIDASAIVVMEGRFESINVEERKFVPLVTQAKRQLTLVGCEEVNRAVVCVPKPPFSGSSSEEEFQERSHEVSERRSQEEPGKRSQEEPEKRSRVEEHPRIERPIPRPVGVLPFGNPLTLVEKYGEAVLQACRKRFADKRVLISYGEFSLEGTISDIKLQTLSTVGRDRSFIKLVVGSMIDGSFFMADHVVFASEFRKLIKGKVRHNNLSFWQRTVVIQDGGITGPNFDTLLPHNVRRFSNEQDIQKFLEA